MTNTALDNLKALVTAIEAGELSLTTVNVGHDVEDDSVVPQYVYVITETVERDVECYVGSYPLNKKLEPVYEIITSITNLISDYHNRVLSQKEFDRLRRNKLLSTSEAMCKYPPVSMRHRLLQTALGKLETEVR